MEHLLVKAATTATDQGVFEAVISTASVDRDGDIVEPQAIASSLQKWVSLGKLMPLAYSHKDPATGHTEVIGHIDPGSVRIQDNEVVVKGWIDQTTDRGQESWRIIKSGTASFSYGFLVPDGGATKLANGGLHISELDVYEISVVPVGPANNDTRVLSFKALPDTFTVEELEQAITDLPEESKVLLVSTVNRMLKADVTDRQPETPVGSVDPLRKQSDTLAMDVAQGHVRRDSTIRRPPAPRQDEDDLRRRSRDMILNLMNHKE